MLAKLAAALSLAALIAAPANAAELTRLPARIEGHNVYLQVRVAGGAPVWMKFDVGVDRSSLTAAGTAPVTLSVGGVALAPVRFQTDTQAALGPDGARSRVISARPASATACW